MLHFMYVKSFKSIPGLAAFWQPMFKTVFTFKRHVKDRFQTPFRQKNPKYPPGMTNFDLWLLHFPIFHPVNNIEPITIQITRVYYFLSETSCVNREYTKLMSLLKTIKYMNIVIQLAFIGNCVFIQYTHQMPRSIGENDHHLWVLCVFGRVADPALDVRS